MNEQALRVELTVIRLLGNLPSDVRVICVLPPPSLRMPAAWQDAIDTSLYLRVRHPYCFLRSDGRIPLTIEDLQDFLDRYKFLKDSGLCPICGKTKMRPLDNTLVESCECTP
jgi:hypothetical protein